MIYCFENFGLLIKCLSLALLDPKFNATLTFWLFPRMAISGSKKDDISLTLLRLQQEVYVCPPDHAATPGGMVKEDGGKLILLK